ncbi:Pentatricopeptide repeat-containing protein At1g62670 [Durusdinium trenchii]|uniref:Mitochondrial n=1 Tax=Durusdinium trenchii TaxID=1381693 RepID=A0ABP0JSB4_9DINO
MVYATRLIWALWEEVSVELVLLLCFCIGFFLLRIHQQKKVFSGGMKGTRRMQPDLAEGSRCCLKRKQLERVQQLLSKGKGDEALELLRAGVPSSFALPGSCLVALFDVLLAVEEVDGADGRLDVAGQLLQLPAGALDGRSILALAHHAAALGNPNAVCQVHRVAVARSMPPSVCEALLKAYATCGVTTAPEAFESLLLTWTPSHSTLHSAIALCTPQSIRLAECLASYARQRHGVTLPISAALLKVYSQAKLWDRACSIYEELNNAGVLPDTATYGALIKAAVEAGRHPLAQHLFQEFPDTAMNVMSMIRAAGRAKEVSKALEMLSQLQQTTTLDATIYNCALEACVTGGDRSSAEKLLKQMSDLGCVDVISYNTYIKLLLQAHLHDEVQLILQEMRGHRMAPNVVTYNSIIKEAASRDMEAAWELVEEMQRQGLCPDAYTASILGAGLRQKPSQAGLDRVLALTRQLDPDDVLVNCLLDVCIRLKDKKRLREVLAWRSKSTAPLTHASTMLMRAHGHAQQMDEAWAIWRDLLRNKRALTEDVFMSMVDACLAGSDLKALLQVFQEVKSWLPGFPRATVAFSLAVKMAMQLQDLELALRLYEETCNVIKLSVVTYNTLIEALVRSGALNRAMNLLHDMAQHDVGPDLITFSILIKGFAGAGDLETAIQLLGQMQGMEIQPDSILFNTILNGCVKRQMRALAEQAGN